jgi:hypothetical protein
MQVGEAVSASIADNNHDEDCYFCKADDPPDEIENALEADPDDDARGYGGFKNDASKLGKALGGVDEKKATVGKRSFPITVAAHHLIPGNASLKKSSIFKSKEYLWIDGKKKGNIGYNVNASPNGVWLPGNYAISGWSGRDDPFKNGYAHSAIQKWRAQFHDAHSEYSTFVLEALEKMFVKIDDIWCSKCPQAKKQKKSKPEERPPMRALVARLNTVSGRMRRMLVAPTKNWKSNVYTSSRSSSFMEEFDHFK